MEALRRRAQQLARIVDARRHAAGEPSMLDLRPNHGPFVGWLLQSFHELISIQIGGMGGAVWAELPYERLSLFLGNNGLPEECRPLFRGLLADYNRWRAEQAEEGRKK